MWVKPGRGKLCVLLPGSPEVAWFSGRQACIAATNRLLKLTASWDAREPFLRIASAVCQWEPGVPSFGVDIKYRITLLGSSAFSLSLQTKQKLKGSFPKPHLWSILKMSFKEGGRKAAAWACITVKIQVMFTTGSWKMMISDANK